MKSINIVSLKMVKESSMKYTTRISSPADVADLVSQYLDNADRENFVVVCLDRKGEPTAIHTVSIGNLHSSIVHPREVFKVAVLSNSASIILAHNHPSGDPTPSTEDLKVTQRIKSAGEILGIDVLDHIIVGDTNYSLDRHNQL